MLLTYFIRKERVSAISAAGGVYIPKGNAFPARLRQESRLFLKYPRLFPVGDSASESQTENTLSEIEKTTEKKKNNLMTESRPGESLNMLFPDYGTSPWEVAEVSSSQIPIPLHLYS